MTLPRIQGADVCGRIVAVGTGVSPSRIGQRVIVRALMRHQELQTEAASLGDHG